MARVPQRIGQLFGYIADGSQLPDVSDLGVNVWGQYDNAAWREVFSDGRTIGGVSAAELAFWIWRVRSFIVSGTITSVDGTASGTFIVTKPGNETLPLTATSREYFDLVEPAPDGGIGGSLAFFMPGIEKGADMMGSTWDMILGFSVEGLNNLGGFVGSGTNSFAENATTGIACELRGTDLVSGETYAHEIILYSAQPDPPTGSITIEPYTFHGYAAADGSLPFYDTGSGAATDYWRKWFATRQAS